jgi:hypothetical protein
VRCVELVVTPMPPNTDGPAPTRGRASLAKALAGTARARSAGGRHRERVGTARASSTSWSVPAGAAHGDRRPAAAHRQPRRATSARGLRRAHRRGGDRHARPQRRAGGPPRSSATRRGGAWVDALAGSVRARRVCVGTNTPPRRDEQVGVAASSAKGLRPRGDRVLCRRARREPRRRRAARRASAQQLALLGRACRRERSAAATRSRRRARVERATLSSTTPSSSMPGRAPSASAQQPGETQPASGALAALGEEAAHVRAQLLLLGGPLEVHVLLGKPSTRSATMVLFTCVVPPAIE